jgi:hypothetical protein
VLESQIMQRLARLEPLAFVILFAAISSLFFKLAPESPFTHLESTPYAATVGAAIAGIVLTVIRFLIKRNLQLEKWVFTVFLAAMPVVYLLSAFEAGDTNGIMLQLVGLVIYGGLAVFGFLKSPLALGLGIAAHGLVWDWLHHNRSAYIENWYSLGCLIVDVAFAFLILTQIHAHNMAEKSAGIRDQPRAV